MSRLAFLSVLVASLAVAPRAAADFNVATGLVELTGAALAVGFEGPDVPRVRIAKQTPAAIPSLVDGLPEAWKVDRGIEGTRALRLPVDHTLVLGDIGSLTKLHGDRIELRFWARADGIRPAAQLVFGREELTGEDLYYPSSAIAAIETGRATSDGWVEYSTGVVDGALSASTKLTAIVFKAGLSPEGKDGGYLLDAVEIRRHGARADRSKSCTLATEDAACGADGACVFGACYDGAIVWGALPSLEHRREIVRRQEQYLVRFNSDRNGAARATTGFSPIARALAETATTSRAFWQPYQRAAADARAAHTMASGPADYHGLAWRSLISERMSANELLSCFGLVDRDLSGSGRGFAVFEAAPTSPLKVGDVLEAIDGEDPRVWLARTSPMSSLSSDPDVDDALHASGLQELVTSLARSIEVTRCASATACSGANATKITIDLHALRAQWATIPFETQPLCSIRFRRGVVVPAGADPESYESAFESVDSDGIAHVLTNGEPSGNTVAGIVNQAFDRNPSKMIIDKRRGDGGGGESLSVWSERVRQDPSYRVFQANRWSFSEIDPPASTFSQLSVCESEQSASVCSSLGASWWGVPAVAKPRPAKIAWLNLVDGSASDLATFYAKGAPGVRIFAPNRTMGLFGALQRLPHFASGLSDAYVQRGDSRLGQTWNEVSSAPWQSGLGLEPDEEIVQKHSDVLLGRDTMLERARAWLKEL